MDSTTTFAYTYTSFPWQSLFPYLFCFILLILTWGYLKKILDAIVIRLKNGSSIKIGSFELESIKVSSNGNVDTQQNHFQTTQDKNQVKYNERNKIYADLRGVMTVHKVFKSAKDGQLFDILIYLIPHKGNNLIQVVSVDYYFGKMWGDKIFTSALRSNGFAIATSAYGPFLCTVTIKFNDGKSITAHRYIDFEMGDVAMTLS